VNGLSNPVETESELLGLLRDWQAKEKDSIAMARETQRRSRNAVVRLVMEIIAHDAVLHHRVEQFLLDSIEKSTTMAQPDEVDIVWSMIAQHNELEKSVLELAQRAQKLPAGTTMPDFLIDYLVEDERKHDALLERLEEIKIKLHPSV